MHANDARARTDEEGVLRRSGEGPLGPGQVLARGSYCAVGDAEHVAAVAAAVAPRGV